MSSENLIVCDNEYEQLEKLYKEFSNEFENMYNCYVRCLYKINRYGIQKGLIHDNIADYLNYAKKIESYLKIATDNASRLSACFIVDIDKADGDFIK